MKPDRGGSDYPADVPPHYAAQAIDDTGRKLSVLIILGTISLLAVIGFGLRLLESHAESDKADAVWKREIELNAKHLAEDVQRLVEDRCRCGSTIQRFPTKMEGQ